MRCWDAAAAAAGEGRVRERESFRANKGKRSGNSGAIMNHARKRGKKKGDTESWMEE